MLNQRMFELGAKRSCIRELFEYGLRQAKLVGKENVLDFSLGNPSVPAPEAVTRAFRELLETGDPVALHSYTPAAGDPKVRAAVAEELSRRSGAPLRPENIFLTCGAAPSLLAVIRALATENAEILAIAPYFPEYRPFTEECGCRFGIVPADTVSFQIDLAALEARITPHTQAVIVNSPNNPSGAVYTKETLQLLAEVLRRKSRALGHPIYVISDEPYRELVYDGAEVPYLPAIYPDTVICYSYSKSFSLPGERIGYVCVPDCAADSAALFTAVAGAARAMGHVCAPSLQQQVIARCADVRPDLTVYDRNRVTLYRALTEYGYECVKPEGAFYLFVRAPGGDANAFSQRARAENLLLVPGDDFGCPGYFRVSTCVSSAAVEKSLPLFRRLICEMQTRR